MRALAAERKLRPNHEFDDRFADRLQIVREARGMTQTTLARRAGMGKNSVSWIEATQMGRTRRRVAIGEAVTLCHVLDVPLGAMLRPGPFDVLALLGREAS